MRVSGCKARVAGCVVKGRRCKVEGIGFENQSSDAGRQKSDNRIRRLSLHKVRRVGKLGDSEARIHLP
jgi:hypothetical protein